MIIETTTLERRIIGALEATPPRIPVLLGGSGSGRTSTLLRLHDHFGCTSCQYIDVERVATTPERCLRTVLDASPFVCAVDAREFDSPATARDAFKAILLFLVEARATGGSVATFLLDEILELRTFENFPGLRGVMGDLVDTLACCANRFVLTSRYVAHAHRALGAATAQFEVIHVPPLTTAEVGAALSGAQSWHDGDDREDLARAVHALADGRPAYVRAIVQAMALMDGQGGGDPVSALAAQLGPHGQLNTAIRYCYELRLHRARGYGALKAILDVLAGEEPLTLTEIAQRLRRTPGSTKDYLSWLEDVDLVMVRQRRYSYVDPLLRLWVRLHCRATPPSEEEVAREVQRYAVGRLPQPEPALALSAADSDRDRQRVKTW